MALDVKRTIAGFAASRGISKSEVVELKGKVSTPTRKQLADLKDARRQFADQFSTSSRNEFDNYVGQFAVVGGKVKAVYSSYRVAWKAASDPKFRERWGIQGSADPKAPMFEQKVKSSLVPKEIREKFLSFAAAFHKREFNEGRLESNSESSSRDQLTDNHTPKLGVAGKILDREHNQIGWIVSANFKDGTSVESYYRKDGNPTGMFFSLWSN